MIHSAPLRFRLGLSGLAVILLVDGVLLFTNPQQGRHVQRLVQTFRLEDPHGIHAPSPLLMTASRNDVAEYDVISMHYSFG